MAKRKIDFTLRDYWNQDSLLLYKEAVSRYPYCAPARLSFLLNLRALDDPDYERELSFTALAVPDRQRLQEEVRAAEQAAAVLRERGERRMRQVAARWAAASATTAALGRLMKTDGAAPAETADGVVMASDAVSAVAVTPESASASGREVDFKAVAANEPGLRMAADAAMADAAAVSGGALDDAASGAEGTASADWMEEYPSARSRSSRRNARRMARREAQKAAEREAAAAMRTAEAVGVAEAAQVAVGAVAESALEAAAAPRTISMLWAEVPAACEAPVAAPHEADAPRATPRHRPEAFNPWAEVFTAKHTISDWLQTGEATDAPDIPDVSDAGASAGSASAAVSDAASMRPAPARKPVSAGKKPAPARKPASAVKPAPAAKPEVEPVASVSVTSPSHTPSPASTPTPSPSPAPDYIDPNELIDRFLRKNDDHILIQVDETRDYSAFDPDRGSLREDWSMGSETLAQLYLKQGAPDKAIEIYRYLGLKFPEKKRYFAGLIRAAEDAKGRK